MRVRPNTAFKNGYNSITEMNKSHSNMLMDFGILKLSKNQNYESKLLERALLLVKGEILLKWSNKETVLKRDSLFDENPSCLHLSCGETVKITGISDDSEIIIAATNNKNKFESKLYTPEECRSEQFGVGVLNETSNRTVRTIFDYNNAPYAKLVIGEVINHPGRWSSYPPHDHPQPEIYYYKFDREQGFGVSIIEDDAYLIRNNDTCCITPGKVHPQVTAPGYPMWYCWVIRHLDDNPFIDRHFRDEHKWLLDPNAKTWPEK
jgi:5-deoxy-glucuronate isomerase